MRNRKRIALVMLVLITVLAGVGLVSTVAGSAPSVREPAALQEYGVNWDVVASGGTTMSSSSFTMLSTTGQAVAGPASGDEHTLFSGYWQKFVSELLLPIIFG